MATNRKTLCAFNYGPHYRQAIYAKMGEVLNVDFVFGDKIQTSIKPLDTSRLKSFKGFLKNKWWRGFYWQKGLLRYFFSYDTFILTGEIKNASSWVILLLSRVWGKRAILWTHGWHSPGSALNNEVQKIYFSLAHSILTYNERGLKILEEKGIHKDKLFCIYNSLDYDTQIKVRQQLSPTAIYRNHFGNDDPVLCFVGRLQKVKQIDILLHAVAQLQEVGKPVNVVLIGTGEDEAALQALSVQLGITSQLWFYGACYEETELGELIYNAQLCVSPGNVGLTAIHAMMYGTPVASHNNFDQQMPESEAIEEGSTGFFFTQGSSASLAQGIDRWLNQHTSSSSRETIRLNAFNKVDLLFNPYRQLEVLMQVL